MSEPQPNYRKMALFYFGTATMFGWYAIFAWGNQDAIMAALLAFLAALTGVIILVRRRYT